MIRSSTERAATVRRAAIAAIALPLVLTAACGDDDEANPEVESSSQEAEAGDDTTTTDDLADGFATTSMPPGATDTTAATGDTVTVAVQLFPPQFDPDPLTVAAGTRITFVNNDDVAHEPTSGTPDAPTDTFDVFLDGEGAEGSATIDEPGEYPYFCLIHDSMTGSITVT